MRSAIGIVCMLCVMAAVNAQHVISHKQASKLAAEMAVDAVKDKYDDMPISNKLESVGYLILGLQNVGLLHKIVGKALSFDNLIKVLSM